MFGSSGQRWLIWAMCGRFRQASAWTPLRDYEHLGCETLVFPCPGLFVHAVAPQRPGQTLLRPALRAARTHDEVTMRKGDACNLPILMRTNSGHSLMYPTLHDDARGSWEAQCDGEDDAAQTLLVRCLATWKSTPAYCVASYARTRSLRRSQRVALCKSRGSGLYPGLLAPILWHPL